MSLLLVTDLNHAVDRGVASTLLLATFFAAIFLRRMFVVRLTMLGGVLGQGRRVARLCTRGLLCYLSKHLWRFGISVVAEALGGLAMA